MTYQTTSYLKSRFETVSRSLAFRAVTLDEWHIWRGQLRSTIRDLLGLDRHMRTAPNARLTETTQCEGYRRERVEIDTEPGVTMPFLY